MSSNELQAAPRWQRRPEDRPDEILDAATTVFGEQGFVRARLEDVAKRAGVSKGTLYLYFDSKESLFRAMVRRKVVTVVEQAEARFENHTGTARAALTDLARQWWSIGATQESACMHRLVNSELTNFPELGRYYFEEVIARMRGLIERIIARGVASGEFRPVAHDYGARGFPSLMIHAINHQRFFSGFDPHPLTDEQMLDGILDLYFNGMVAAPGAAPKAR